MRTQLTIFLLKKSITTIDEAAAECLLNGFIEQSPIEAGLRYPARCFTRASRSAQPKWLKFFEGGFDFKGADLRTRSSSLILFLRASKRIFAITSGAGFHRIPKTAIERDFGLRATLNAVGPDTLRSLQSRTVDPLRVQKLVVANRNTTVQTLDLDRFRELLARLEGKPVDQKLGFVLSGSDSLSLVTDASISGLDAKCKELLRLSERDTYKAHFGFVDQMRPERDAAVVEALEHQLRAELRDPTGAQIALALPTIESYGDISSYVLRHRRADVMDLEDLRTELLLRAVGELGDDVDPLTQTRVVALDATGEVVLRRPLSEWLVAELRHAGTTHVLSAGGWYAISDGFVSEVNARLGSIGVIQARNYLPRIRRVDGRLESEGDYNLRCASDRRVCLDKKTITMERYGAIEPCDLFTDRRHVIHVKKQTSSATLSHLWGQGVVGSELLLDSREFRKELRARLGEKRDLVPLERITPSDFTIVYAIASDTDPFPSRLPFFSKVNLLHHYQELDRMGFRVRLYRIRTA